MVNIKGWSNDEIARKIAIDIPDGSYVNPVSYTHMQLPTIYYM
mgnify:CR=1 FL=1